MKSLFLIIAIFFAVSCSTPDDPIAPPPDHTTELNTRDTCLRVLIKYAREDTFLYERFYDERTFIDGRISYVRTGTFIFPDKKTAVIVYTPSDTTVAIELFAFENDAWTLLDKRLALPHNGMLFFADYSDYNFDGIRDIYINLIVSSGFGFCTGHLLTVTEKGTLQEHPETRGIRTLLPDSATKTVLGHVGIYGKDSNYVCDETYKWIDNKLVRTSLPCTK